MIRKNNKRALYESIMKDVAKTVKRHLNEVSQDLVNRSIASAENKLKDPKLNSKIRKGLKNQIETFKNYKQKNFVWEEDFNMFVDAVTYFYNHIDAPAVQEILIDENDYDYDEIAQTQYDINWDNIKKIMKHLYKGITADFDWSNGIASILEYLCLVYLSVENDTNWYDYSWAEEDYPNDEEYEDYGEALQDIQNNYSYKTSIINLFNELPEPLLIFISHTVMGFFYEDDWVYGL